MKKIRKLIYHSAGIIPYMKNIVSDLEKLAPHIEAPTKEIASKSERKNVIFAKVKILSSP